MFKGRRAWQWLERLAKSRLENVFNPWGERNAFDLPDDGPGSRKKRLKAHLANQDAKLLMIGEAPGHLGCSVSGIPFTSEKLLFEGVIPRLDSQTQRRISSREKPFSEPSATIVWTMLFELGIADRVVLWNAFPWHPHKKLNPSSNRTPTRQELALGLEFLQDLAGMYEDVCLVAIGRKSEQLLAQTDYEYEAVRHPSMGGSKDFRDGLKVIVEKRL